MIFFIRLLAITIIICAIYASAYAQLMMQGVSGGNDSSGGGSTSNLTDDSGANILTDDSGANQLTP